MSDEPRDATEPTAGPRWMAWVAWGAGALGLYGLLLGPMTMDAIDAELPRRSKVRENASSHLTLTIEVAPEGEDSDEIRDALSVLPDLLVEVARAKDARVVITNLEAIAARGVEPGDPVSHVAGYFTRADWRLFVAHDAARAGLVALHEYGHFVDAALGDCSATPEFTTLYDAAVASGKLGEHHRSAAAEAFAFMFSQHFFSDRRRARLATDYPDAARYFEALAASGLCKRVLID